VTRVGKQGVDLTNTDKHVTDDDDQTRMIEEEQQGKGYRSRRM
jgi:hypothetical protein